MSDDRMETWKPNQRGKHRQEASRQEMGDAAGLEPHAIDDALEVDPGARHRLTALVKKQRDAKALGQWKENE